MIAHVVAWYARRIVNVNINIVLAGVLALPPVLVCVKIAEALLASGIMPNGQLQQRLQAHHQAVIAGVTLVSDIIFDVAIYFVLHWLANHYPKRFHNTVVEQRIEGVAQAAVENVPFFKDAAKVQLQRAVLSPLLYILWLGVQFAMMNVFQWSAVWATVAGFCVAIGSVRSLHTFWMLREERALRAVVEGFRCRKCGYDLSGVPCEGKGVCPECAQAFVRNGPPAIAGRAPGADSALANGHGVQIEKPRVRSGSPR